MYAERSTGWTSVDSSELSTTAEDWSSAPHGDVTATLTAEGRWRSCLNRRARSATSRPDERAARIAEVVKLPAAGVKERPKG